MVCKITYDAAKLFCLVLIDLLDERHQALFLRETYQICIFIRLLNSFPDRETDIPAHDGHASFGINLIWGDYGHHLWREVEPLPLDAVPIEATMKPTLDLWSRSLNETDQK